MRQCFAAETTKPHFMMSSPGSSGLLKGPTEDRVGLMHQVCNLLFCFNSLFIHCLFISYCLLSNTGSIESKSFTLGTTKKRYHTNNHHASLPHLCLPPLPLLLPTARHRSRPSARVAVFIGRSHPALAVLLHENLCGASGAPCLNPAIAQAKPHVD